MRTAKDLWRSITLSAKRNGWAATAYTIGQYFRMKCSRSPLFRFYVPGLSRAVLLRPGDSDFSVLRQIFMNGEYDIDTPPGIHTIVDAGANIGLASLRFNQLFPNARIFAIEPDPENFKLLQRNTAGIGQIVPLHCALWHQTEALRFSTGPTAAWGVRVESARPSDSQTVPGVTLPALMDTYQLNRLDIVKIDIEGAELELFRNNPAPWLAKTGILIAELHEGICPGVEQAFLEATDLLPGSRGRIGENVIFRSHAVV